MSDEIDIEEHDVMDNPSIKKIFPDLSVIKQEINQYDYEGTVMQDVKAEQPTQGIDCMSYSETYITCGENEKGNDVIDTKVNILTKNEPLKEANQLHGNIIILGSKPNKECETHINKNEQKAEPQIILKRIDLFLKESRSYCDQCLILFPKPNFYSLHYINVHSEKRKGLNGILKCLKCNEIFSSTSNLIRHKKNAHKNSQVNKQKIITNKHSEIKSVKGNHCFHCQKLFPTQNSLIEHLYEVLTPKNTEKSSKDEEKQANISENVPDLEEKMNVTHNMDNQLKENNKQEIETATKASFTGQIKNETKMYSKYSIKCDKCNERFYTQSKLRYHNMTAHKHCKKLIPKNKIKQEKSSNGLKDFGRLFYRCPFCSKYNVNMKFYSLHILSDHKIQLAAKAKKIPFNPQCSFCPSKLSYIKSYNTHLYRNHKKKVKQHINTVDKEENIEDNSAVKSVLFQCLECDTHFLSAQEARSHLMHSKLLSDWKCNMCHRKFKTKDELLHKDQHASDNIFIEYSLSKSALIMVLYKCFKCTVHYSEDTFLEHNGNCDSKTPNSMYCHFCDILVNTVDMEFHESHHEQSRVINSDFTVIETDMLDTRSVRLSKEIQYKILCERAQKKGNLVMKFCNTCKCFLTNSNFIPKVHLEAKCSHIVKAICKLCGLVLTAKSHISHVRLHKAKQIKFQDYLFYDLKSKKLILPPIPDYPNCNLCGIHFSGKSEKRVHMCKKQEYKTCNICSIKLNDHAYKLHMSFHTYSLENVTTEAKHEDIEPMDDDAPHLNTSFLDNAILKTNNFLYTCRSCQVSVKTYDDVIRHCQDHYDCKKIQLKIRNCRKCRLAFLGNDCCCPTNLNIISKIDKDDTCNIANFTTIDFDPCYMRFNNTFWTRHIFAYISDEQIIKILDNSMYRDECRLKMEELQPGPSNCILYKCDKCQVIIEPHSLYTHVETSKSSSCVNSGKYPCAHCGLCFSSWKHRATQHEENAINPKSCRIILFNKTQHDTFNQTMFDACNKYVLYQCRKCERVVDKFQRNDHECDYSNLKMCMNCGLLFHMLDYDLHFIRHEELDKFNTDYMCVVMFGKNNGLSRKILRSTFKGARLDFTFYKCKNCELSVKSKKYSMARHICVFDDSKCKCSKCGLYFLEKDLLGHCKLHDTHLDELNVNIITYNVSAIVETSTVKSTKEIIEVENNLLEEADRNDFKDKNDFNVKTDFKDINDFKDKNDFRNKNDFKVNINCKVKTYSKTKNALENKINCDDKNGSVVKENISNCKIYKCDCGLHFLEYENARNHVDMCSVRMKISKQSCSKCDLLFSPGELFNHLLVHHCDKKFQYKFDIIMVHKNNEITDIS